MYNTAIFMELLERNFCNVLAMKLASPLGGMQQAGELETAAKSVNPRFTFQLVITSAYIQVCISLSPTSTRGINLR